MIRTDKNKLLILHSQNTFNNGSFMMLINFIHYYDKVSSVPAEFICDLASEQDFVRLKKELEDHINITRIDLKITTAFNGNMVSKFLHLLRKLFLHPRSFKKMGFSAVVILGGDDVSEYYKGWQVISDLYRLKKYTDNLPVFLSGQTIGPFRSWRKKMASICLKKCYLFCRDEISYEYSSNELFLKKLYLSADLAFLDLPVKLSDSLIQQIGIEKEKYFVIVPSGFSKLYTDSEEEYIKSWKLIINLLTEMECLQQYKWVLLPHVTRPEDDRRIITSIVQSLNKEQLNNIIPIFDELLPSEARAIIGNAYFTISGRMHSSISSFQMGKPAITLSYSIKYQGVIGKGLGRSDLIIEAKGDRVWETNEIATIIKTKVEYLVENYNEIRKDIVIKMKDVKLQALCQIQEIEQLLKMNN